MNNVPTSAKTALFIFDWHMKVTAFFATCVMEKRARNLFALFKRKWKLNLVDNIIQGMQ